MIVNNILSRVLLGMCIRDSRYTNCPGIDGFAMLERLHQARLNGSGKLERFVLELSLIHIYL